MQTGNDRLVRFVEHVKNSRSDIGRRLNVLDLRLECRAQRLTEFSDWPASDLDFIEQQAACHSNETDLTKVLSGTAGVPAANGASSWLDSPSPYAWT